MSCHIPLLAPARSFQMFVLLVNDAHPGTPVAQTSTLSEQIK